MRSRFGWYVVAVGLGALAWGCSTPPATRSAPASEEQTAMQGPIVDRAVAVMHPTEGHEASGVVRFTREGDAVRVSVHLEGLAPGEHGFHIHEFGDCSAPDATSAGGHFNPFGAPHGARDAAQRHVGDLGNVTADDAGKVDTEFVDRRIALPGHVPDSAASILGRGVIVHAGRDDLETQPSGAAGPRIACGVVGIAGPEKGE